jgi:3-isopropylmalate/(R)-2-methylmalate dehydratase small subunit
MKPITRFRARTLVLPFEGIDTDQIIPARFLKTTVREGLGRALFADFLSDRAELESRRAGILVAGDNFGIGSSREHAVWALMDAGFKVVVSTRIADIFRSNALKNGLLPIVVSPELHRRLLAQPCLELTVDLEAGTLALPDGSATPFPIEAFARHCLLRGLDEMDYLLGQEALISAYESRGASCAP